MTPRISALVFGLLLGAALAPALASPQDAPTGKTLQKIDTVVGKGREVKPGSRITMHYAGWMFSPKQPKQHGLPIDNTPKGKPFTFVLGAPGVIKGWNEGLLGMKVGGKRTLVVPGEMAFGKLGMKQVPPNANLIFDIDLVDVK
ncbi:MAG: FKBP-type peptidyl-prolyl cis-trans isomerase [Pseudomonadota bacterium]